MKKLFLILLSIPVLRLGAQMSNVESAVIYLRNSEVESAKESIDAAAINDATKDDPKMWSVRAAVYDTIYRNPEYKKLDNNTEEKFVVACLKCMQTDTKKRYNDYCSFAVINSAFAAYNKAIEYYSAKDSKNALKFFQYVMDVFPYDKNGDLKKNNISEKAINKSIADLFYIIEDYNSAISYYDKLIKIDYNEPSIYAYSANSAMMLHDTARGMEFIDKGRKRFPTDQVLIRMELSIYLAQGKRNVLLDKLNEALNLDPENSTFLFVRGNIYDNFASDAMKGYKHAKDTSSVLSQKAKNEKVPASKTKMEASSKKYVKLADSLKKDMNMYFGLAEKDYLDVTKLTPDYLDAWYNLGALMNNRTTEVVEKMNALTMTSQAEYDRQWNSLKKVKDSILVVALGYFNKALEQAEALPDNDAEKKKFKNGNLISLYYSLQQVYANLGDEKKTIEMKKKRQELESQQD